jgi:hypothetical protein
MAAYEHSIRELPVAGSEIAVQKAQAERGGVSVEIRSIELRVVDCQMAAVGQRELANMGR